MNSPKISVVVPVYNTEKYLKRCLDSILSQTFADFELLLIDDGSNDTSAAILDEYAYVDSRVRVFHKENEGVSIARNIGIENAKGNWIIFIDSDDWVSECMFEYMLNKADSENSDIVYCNLLSIYAEERSILHISKYARDKETMLNNFIKSSFSTIIGMLVKSDLYIRNSIKFPVDVKYCEDFFVAAHLMLYADRISYLSTQCYYYNRDNPTSATSNFSCGHSESVRWVYSETIKTFKEERVFDNYAESLSWKLLNCEQDLVLDKQTHNQFLANHPECHRYIWSCPYLNLKVKIIMWALCHKLKIFVDFLLFMRNIRLKYSTNDRNSIK